MRTLHVNRTQLLIVVKHEADRPKIRVHDVVLLTWDGIGVLNPFDGLGPTHNIPLRFIDPPPPGGVLKKRRRTFRYASLGVLNKLCKGQRTSLQIPLCKGTSLHTAL